MNVHKNARLTPRGRALLVSRILDDGLRPEEAAQACGVSVRTAYKWLRRFREEGEAGLNDRSSRPKSCPHALPAAVHVQVIAQRRSRQTYRQMSQQCGIGQSTIARWLQRAGLNRLAALEPANPIVRYEHPEPGDMLHLDIKKLGRFQRPGHRVTADRTQNSRRAGWEFVHVALDDHSRVAFADIQPDESGRSACQALLSALRHYRQLGVTFQRVLTDNGACYKSRRFARLCQRLGLRHLRTKPYTPQTNGKAERFIQTALREWAYARRYESSDHRAQHLPLWLHHYNWHRPHASLQYLPPISRVNALNNVAGLHT
ncbi:IS481 family transposase [Rhodocyclus tenuis]|uniref:Transposase InsO family protein n=1 Tax=Rhodocyclus tenuis TaxID=1066 RepID=A0A840GHY6_RHOTE|nr:IS481 family transposase [Rhodocyclus tenuis]MBB4248092.1 transposase InsO family protein [Rhodocyclus tenuis]